MDKTLRLDYTFKPISFEKINSEFSLMRCYVMALGKNRNYSYFNKESVEAAIPSLFNIPIVAHLKKRDGGWYVGSHDRQIVIDDEGITVNDLTIPFGCVPESCSAEWVDVTEKDGTTATYLTASIILWTGRYPELLEAKSQTDEDVYYNQSMEISISSWSELEEDKKYVNITGFNFSALCLLGRDLEDPDYHTEPCFPSARVEPIEFSLEDKFTNEFSLMLEELKKLSIDFENIKFSQEKEEEKVLNEKLELIAKYNLTVDQLDFTIDEISLEDLEIKLKEFVKQEPEDNNTEMSFSATHNQIREALRNALDREITRDADGNIIDEVYYWIADSSEDYAFVERSHWTASGDYDSKYGRFTYTFDESTMTATITSEFEEMFLMWLTAEEKAAIDAANADYESIKSEFDKYKEVHITAEDEVIELRNFQTERLKAERDDAETEIFDKFDEKLKDNEEYLSLKEKSSEYDLEALQKECFSILGRSLANFSFNVPKKKDTVKIPFEKSDESEPEVYGGLHKKYINK